MEIQEVFIQAIALVFSQKKVSGCLGMLPPGSEIPTVFFSKEKNEIIEAETIAYLQTHDHRKKEGSPILNVGTPHIIHGVVFKDSSVSCFYSPERCEGTNQAIAFICGYYQYFKNKRGARNPLDERFFDMLLLGISEYQKKYLPGNEHIVPVSQRLFKPEVFVLK